MKSAPTTQILTRMLIDEAPHRKKAEFLNCYLKLVVSEGFEAATLTRIAKERATSKALVHYYLPDLGNTTLEIFSLCSKHGVEFTVDYMERGKDEKDKLLRLLRAPYAWFFEHTEIARFVFVTYQKASIDKKIAEVHKKNLEAGRKRLAEAFQKTLGDTPKDAERKAHLVHSQIIATLILMHSTNDIHKNSAFIMNYEYLVEKVLGLKFKVFPLE